VRALDRSDLWFGVILAAFFGLYACLFFGQASTDPAFWSRLPKLLPIVGLPLVISVMRDPLRKLDWAPRAVSWFGIGFTAATIFLAFGGDHESSLATAVGLGLVLAVFEFVTDKYLPKKVPESG
jgi:hypothetical protein